MDIQSNLTFQSQQTKTDPEELDRFSDLDSYTLHEAVQRLFIDCQADVPFIIWLLENPASPIALPGKIDLYGHDCIHVMLGRAGHSLAEEAFVIGFTMGNDLQTNWFHQLLFKLISSSLYPKKYRFSWKDFRSFDVGFFYGRSMQFSNLNRIDFSAYQNYTVSQVKRQFGISKENETELLKSFNSYYAVQN
ncbi:MAG: hypothetical protein KME16_17130 [Scytolyngbya sp. HA4215-MV1]|jgi:hypothetical protein|nr:hypothetical protein [Scytolyngbya sp. HA4215-MV1]